MSQDEEKYKEELKRNGVEIPEADVDADAKAKEEADANAKADTDAKAVEDAKAAELLKTKKPEEEERKPRSIYDEYKDQKSERKLAEDRAVKAEQERDELKQKLDDATKAKDGTAADDAAEDAIAYAKKVNADPELVQRIIADARKGFEGKTDPEVMKRLQRFEEWEKSNSKTMEAQHFSDEFATVLPSLKADFPNASDDELGAIKKELDAISHTREWHDKTLDYVVFKNKDKLTALVSPKKRGMENKGRKEGESVSFEFDPNADLSTMTPKQRNEWEKTYRAATKSDELITTADGKKLML